jgi:Na+/melibiose symporter-like transporter
VSLKRTWYVSHWINLERRYSQTALQFTVAPAATSACTLLVISFSSDHFQERGLHMVGALSISLVGYLLLMFFDTATQKGVAYFAIFLCTIGVGSSTILSKA